MTTEHIIGPDSKALNEWWRGAVIYQIYPRSYQDSNDDGVGDLRGITQRLDYLSELGVDGIWISPFFKSPMKDFGYDVSDYRDIDPLFGTMDDFRKLLDRAHALGIKIIVDLVMSHTSEEHPWFEESRKTRDNPKADWYIWADPKPDGTPPNNWQASFGGPAWTYNAWRGQYYMHNFLPEQPDLNYHNPDVVNAVLDTFKFWLDFGVDGFRLDTVNYYLHDARLWDNPPQKDFSKITYNLDFPTPYLMQEHRYDKTQMGNIANIQKIRALCDQYDDRMTVGEIGDELYGVEVSAQYTDGPDKLHTAYNFSLMAGETRSAAHIRKSVEAFEQAGPQSWVSWAFSNHDVIRSATRWSREGKTDPAISKMLIAILASLRGTAFIYQGDELGLPEAHIPFDRIQDPWGKYLYPKWQGRDGCRSPMPWDDSKNAGFTKKGEPWLPIPDGHKPLSVKKQLRDPQSVLRMTKALLKWRKDHPVLRNGTIKFINGQDDDVLAFERDNGQAAILCLFNISETQKSVSFGSGYKTIVTFSGTGAYTSNAPEGSVTLEPWGFAYLLAASSPSGNNGA